MVQQLLNIIKDKQQLLKVKIRKKTEQDIHDFFETLCCYTAD